MKPFFSTLLSLTLCININAQDVPLKIEVPPLSADPNMPFSILNFDVMGKDKFSVLYVHIIYGSVLNSSEFVSDTGQTVFKDQKRRDPVLNSNAVVLLKKQIIDGRGALLASEEWLLAQRLMESSVDYKLYYAKNFKHPLVPNRSLINKTIYNLDAVKGLNEAEMTALTLLAQSMMPPELRPREYTGIPTTPDYPFAEDILATKRQFKALRNTGILLKGDLPLGESILTRFNIVSDRIFVITRVKEKEKTNYTRLKFYVSADYKIFDCLDSTKVEGEVSLTSAAPVYNTNSEAIGAFANLLVKKKGEKGEDVMQQLSVAMDADYTVATWLHFVGKNKLNSLSPEICWYESSKLWVMSNNREKFFKSYMQVHVFEKGQPAQYLFPLTEEEKGTEKTKFVKTFQPTPANGVGTAPPLPEKYAPIYFTTAGTTRYIVMQGTRFDEATKNRQYLSLNIYRMEATGKVTHVDLLSDYKAFIPMPFQKIVKNPEAEFSLLQYPLKLQLAFYADRSELSPLDAENASLVLKPDRTYITTSPYGSALLRRANMGNKLTLLFYPQL